MLGVSVGYRRNLLSKSLVNSITSAPNMIVLAPISKIDRTSLHWWLAESFRARSLTSAFGLVSVPGLEIRAVIADPNSGQSGTAETGVQYTPIAIVND